MRVRVFAIERPPLDCPVCGMRLEAVTVERRRVIRCSRHGTIAISPDVNVHIERGPDVPTRH